MAAAQLADDETITQQEMFQMVAKHMKVTTRTVRERWAHQPGFPKPTQRISAKTASYSRRQIQNWLEGKK